MTPRERAKDIVDSMKGEIAMPHLCAIKIEKAITAAIEEDRASGECCKREREACAKIGDYLAEHTDSYDRQDAYRRMTRMIRGRSLDTRSEREKGE